jgi:hypothetical protein
MDHLYRSGDLCDYSVEYTGYPIGFDDDLLALETALKDERDHWEEEDYPEASS